MDLKSGLPFSLIKNGLVRDYPKLSKNIRADVIVLGGGISGALTAWHLLQKDIDTVLIDGRTIGLGSTCASSSLLLYEIDVPLVKLEKLRGKETAQRAYRISYQSINKLKTVADKIGFTGIQKKESIYYAAKQTDIPLLQKEYKARRKLGIDVEYLGKNEVFAETGLNAGAALISSRAAQTDAYMLTHALLADCSRMGLKIYDRSKAVAIEHSHHSVLVRTGNGYTITAKKIIYATGYETVDYIDKPIVKLKSTYATISESNPDQPLWKKERLIWNTADPYLYIRTTPGQRIMIGGRDENFYSPRKRNRLLQVKTKQLAQDFKRLFPEIEFAPEFSWTGTFGYTNDGLPYIGTYPKLPNSFFALGFGGNGISFSMIAAEIISDLVLGKKNKNALVFAFDR